MEFDSYRIGSATSLTVTVATSVIAYTLPPSQVALDAASGRSSSPRYVRVLAEGACYINFGGTGVGCTIASSMLLTSNSSAEIICVAGFSNFAVVARSAATNISVTPIEV
jgi:hypothetical protein